MTKKTKSKVAATPTNLQTSTGFWLAKSEPDVYGIANLKRDKRSEFFDAAATKEQPRWSAVELAFETEFARVISLEELRAVKSLSHLLILQRGNRLSVTPVQPAEFRAICDLA